MARLRALDGLRGVAALTVLVSHSANDGLLPRFLGGGNGQMGVVVFFVLSGFLMAHLYASRPLTDLPIYALHRFARIVPLYLAIVLISIVVRSGVVWTFPIDTPAQVALHLTFLHGVRTLWTIPVEVQFYFLFALIWLSPRKAFPALLVAGFALAPVMWLLGLGAETLPFWLHLFLLGSLCGLTWHKWPAVPQWVGWPILAFAILALPGFRQALHIPQLYRSLDPITVSAAALLFCGTLLGLGPLRVFEAAWARWLGKISYGVYLIHLPVLMTLRQFGGGVPMFLAVVAVTLALAELSFRYFENPVRKWLTAKGEASRHFASRPKRTSAPILPARRPG